jgi:CHAT domain-containing protein/Tfp pilus assembly protein PilF
MFRPVASRLTRPGFLSRSLCIMTVVALLMLSGMIASRGALAGRSRTTSAKSQQQPASQSPTTAAAATVLELGKPVERELAGGQSHSYQITLAEGQFVSVIVEQHGIDVAVRVLGPNGEQIAEFDSEIRKQGQEQVSQVAEVVGSYRLIVLANQKKASAGSYEVRVAERRVATEKDRALQEAHRLNIEFRSLYSAGKYNDARQAAERALETRERVLGPEHPDVAQSLHGLAVICHVNSDYAKAEQLYQRALAIREKTLGPEHPSVATSLNNLAALHYNKGDYARAEPLYQRALAIREKVLGPEHPDIAQSLNNLANLYQVKSDYTKAEPLYRRALEMREKVLELEHPDVADSLNNLAVLYSAKSDYVNSERLHQRALEISEKAFGPGHPAVADSLHNLAVLHRERGDYVKAEVLYQRSLAISEKVFGPDHLSLASSFNELALLHRSKGDHVKAESLHQRALTIREKALGSNHPDVADSLNNLAALYQAQGDYAKAEPLHQRALAIRERIFGLDQTPVATSLNNLAALYYDKGDYAKAKLLYQRALPIFEKVLGPGHNNVATCLYNLSRLYSAEGEITQAVTFRSRARAVSERNLVLNLATGSERQKLAYLATLSSLADQTIALHVRSAANNLTACALAATTVLQRKGRVLDAMADSLGALRSRFDAQDQALLDQFRDINAQLARLVLGGPQRTTPAEHQKQIKDLEEQKEKLEAEISRRSAEFRVQAQPITLDAVRAVIPDNAALIEFAAYRPFNPKASKESEAYGESRYVAYILRREGEIQWQELGEAKAIDSAVDALRRALRDPKRQDVKDLSRALDAKVMQPLRALVGETRHLLVSPDGALNLIPFAALVDERGRYLVERYSFNYLTSGRDLLRLQAARESRSAPLVVANPDFGEPETTRTARADVPRPRSPARARTRQSVTTGADLSNVYFGALRASDEEAWAIKALFPQAAVLTRGQATEAALKQAAAPQILHIATHGFFLEDQPVKIEGTRGDGGLRGLSANVKVENPLLRSGLALAGANPRQPGGDDGLLTALEAAGLNLWGTRLVVLSACDTGLGEVRTGEGVYGLRRALVLAGAETQVMSLWAVSDRVTRELMTAYYAGLRQGQGRGEALRQVQLKMLRRPGREHPFYWASFIQSGEWAGLDGRR